MDKDDLMKLGSVMANLHMSANTLEKIGSVAKSAIADLGYQITKKPEAWNGEGLPPVGTKCEANHGGTWVAGTIVHHSKHDDALILEEDEILAFWSKEFRPIRTEEEKLLDEALDFIRSNSVVNVADKGASSKAIKVLIDAGWRPNN